ncbi:hypothetical protein NQ315_012543 [Exocentrus adspersus]|uniref:DNA polymerase epsilon catalytic subunit n=1 Tax=Exocentrus adspersus TaxID=1586481 RepID=A0AAV8VCX5_9CUCU|nr:hypothetical protein NQ315_012543 [Exocentrus adspersus]
MADSLGHSSFVFRDRPIKSYIIVFVKTFSFIICKNIQGCSTLKKYKFNMYEYKGMSKKAKQAVADAIKGGDASEIKSAKNREVLYDSLQLAHKCILNSFYGYVMRRGWKN